ncbi:DUF1028 domain-containing protein [Dactylosporangium sp. NPDC051485]|uniref:DUF1028 domain-containing protein n=1 Tax=Dactylosporangium sp. NPDC051485 TaxID=3154846 RepID=UPI0034150557
MTFSIVGRCADGQSLGVAVASKFLAVGAAVPAAEAAVGAIATQALANLAYRPQGLALLRTGTAAADVVAGLLAADAGRAGRQLGVVGPTGDGATYTGDECFDWAGGVSGDGYAIQGNILAGPAVVAEMERAWLAGPGLPLARRLHAALAAGDAAGGDSRGRQSAAILVVRPGAGYGGLSDVEVDLRVDDDPDPVTRIGALISLWELYFGKPDPATLLPLEGELADEVRDRLAALGHADLAAWAGIENLEERLVDGAIDPLVLARLRAAEPR